MSPTSIHNSKSCPFWSERNMPRNSELETKHHWTNLDYGCSTWAELSFIVWGAKVKNPKKKIGGAKLRAFFKNFGETPQAPMYFHPSAFNEEKINSKPSKPKI